MSASASTPPTAIELMAFEHTAAGARRLREHGVDTLLVDWEFLDKEERQRDFDTDISSGTVDELRAVAAVPGAPTWCRLNRFGAHTLQEVEVAVGAGAAGVFLPMATWPSDVERFLVMVDGRVGAGILVETVGGLAQAGALAKLPVQRVYFGLNDFAISRGGGSIFRAVLDGSVERAREAFAETPFGFAGLTAMDAGSPVPCRYLLAEMARLGCTFSFLRRSFRRDLATRRLAEVIAGIRTAWHECAARDALAIARDRATLEGILRGLV
jgi:hypothetical protein